MIVAGTKRQRLRNLSSALIEWIVEDQQDLSVVQHEKFLDVLAAAGIKAVIPPLDALQKAMERKYYALFTRVSEYINRSAVGRITFSCDTWSGSVY